MSKFFARSKRSIVMAMVAVTFALPAASAAAIGEYPDGPNSFWTWGSASGYAWSRFEHSAKNHGSSAYGDKGGLVRSTCKAPGVRAYAESAYSLIGGERNYYWRLC